MKHSEVLAVSTTLMNLAITVQNERTGVADFTDVPNAVVDKIVQILSEASAAVLEARKRGNFNHEET